MGECVEKLPCPRCGSSDALQVFQEEDGTYNGLCFACPDGKGYFHNPYEGGIVHNTEEKKYEYKQADPTKLPEGSIPERKIRLDSSQEYGVRVAYSEEDGRTVVKSYYPDRKGGEVVGWEERNHINKRFSAIGDRKGALDLWGKDVAMRNNGKKLFITEGRLDALSLYQTIIDHTATKWKHLKPSVVSLTRGASGAVKDLLNNREFVESFDEVVLVFDNDEAGKAAVRDVTKTFPLFKSASLPLKDANDMIMEGRGKELFDQCMWNAQYIRQGEVVRIDDNFIERALERPKMGISTPWPSLDKAVFGIRPNKIWVVGAAPKIGKSEFKNQLIQHLAFTHGRPVGVYDLEVHPINTSKQIVSKEVGVNFLRPDVEYSDEDLANSLRRLRDTGVQFYDRAGSRDWADIRNSMEEQHLLDGVCEFFLDPLTALISKYSASEANDALNTIMTDMADMVFKHPITIFCFSHVNNKPKTSTPHERGGKVLSSEFTGSRSLEKWSNYGFGLNRDRSEECPLEEQNISYLSMLYDRDFGRSTNIPLFYDERTTRYLEATGRL